MRILIIEDDSTLRQLLETFLRWKGYDMTTAQDGTAGLKTATAAPPDLVILDVMMPGMDGWEVCRNLRKATNVPILMLSAKSTQDDVVQGLECGADDYVKKPFDLRELELRIKAILKRASFQRSTSSDLYDDGNLKVHIPQRTVHVKGRLVHLTPTEFRLLAYLLKSRDRAVPHEELLREVWGPQYVEDVASLQVYIRYLREKIEENPGAPHYICTRRGVGYRFGPEN
jgi:DNA-binding response OmpR family regulator